MSTAKKTPQSVNTSQDPALEYLNQRAVEIAITPTENSTKSVVYEEVTQVITNVFQVNAPSGANGQLQFNQGGQYTGDAELQYDPYTDTLTTGKIVANNITITGNANNFKLAGGYNNEVLKTDGNGNLSWANVFPSVSGKSGKFLVTNGVSIDWSNGNYNSFATTTYVDSAIATLVGTAPAMLNTLAEIANVIGQTNDPQYGIISQLANKANISNLAQVAFSGSYADLSNRPNISNVGISGNYTDLSNKPTIPATIRDLGISEGTNGQVLTTNGNGNYSFTTVSSGGSSYDQSLNTTNNVTFSSIVTSNISFSNANLEIYTSANSGKSIDIYTDWGGNRGGVEVWLRHNDGVEINTKDGDFTWKFANTGALNFPLTPNVTSAIVVNDNDTELSMGTDRGSISIWPENSKWLFGADGNLTLPNGTTIDDKESNLIKGPALNSFGSNSYTGTFTTLNFTGLGTTWVVNGPGVVNGVIQSIDAVGKIIILDRNSGGPQFQNGQSYTFTGPSFSIGSKITVNINEWLFGADGKLTLPGAVKSQSVAQVGQIVTYIGISGGSLNYTILSGLTPLVGAYSDIQVGWTVSDNKGWSASVTAKDNSGLVTIDTQWGSGISDRIYYFTSPDYEAATAEDITLTAKDSSLKLSANGAITLPNSGGVIKSTASSTILNGAFKSYTFAIGAFGILTGFSGNGVSVDRTPESEEIQVGWTCTFSDSPTVFTVTYISYISNTISISFDGQTDNVVFPMVANSPTSSIKLQPVSGGSTWTFSGNGNLTLPANTFAVNYANGTQVSLGGGGGNANTGNVTFDDLTVQGDNSQLNLSAGADFTANLAYLQVRSGDVASHIHLDTGNNEAYDLIVGNDQKFVQVSSTGNIIMSSYDGNTSHIMTFGTDGNLTTPSSLVIGSRPGGGSVLQQNDAALDIIGEGSSAGVQLGWAANLSAPDSVALIAMNSIVGEGAGNLVIAVGNNATTVHSWLFGNNGNLKLPAGGDIVDSTGTSVLGSGIALTDLSIGTDGTPTGGGNVSYNNTTGVFTYTPPNLSTYLTTITNIFDQALNTTNNVTFSSVITSNVQATNGSPARASPVAIGGAGAPLTISAGDGGIAATGVNAGAGGNLTITAGDAGSDIGNPSWGEIGGTLVLRGGNSSRPYHGSDVQIHSGNAVASPGAISLYTGTNQWTFGKDGTTTLANNATIISPLNGLTVRVTGQYNICTLLTGGSGYGSGGSSSAISGGTGTGMIVGYGYGLSGQVVNVGVTDPGTGYQDGDVLTMTAGNGGATFVITKYNTAANAGNNNTAPSDWIFGTTNNLTLPLGGDIKDSTGTSVLFSGDYTDLTNQPTIPAAQIQSDWTQATNTALDYIKNKPTILAEPAFSVQTADFNATAGSRYGYNTTAGVVTATLPASPSAGDAIYFADASGTTSTNNFIIARNGGTIMGSASDMTTNTNDQSFGLFYNGTTWRVY